VWKERKRSSLSQCKIEWSMTTRCQKETIGRFWNCWSLDVEAENLFSVREEEFEAEERRGRFRVARPNVRARAVLPATLVVTRDFDLRRAALHR
jgi:hypothetical protein